MAALVPCRDRRQTGVTAPASSATPTPAKLQDQPHLIANVPASARHQQSLPEDIQISGRPSESSGRQPNPSSLPGAAGGKINEWWCNVAWSEVGTRRTRKCRKHEIAATSDGWHGRSKFVAQWTIAIREISHPNPRRARSHHLARPSILHESKTTPLLLPRLAPLAPLKSLGYTPLPLPKQHKT